MVWWIVAAIVLVALIVLVFGALSVLARVRELRHAERALRLRAEQARQLQEPVLALQRRIEAMQQQLIDVQQWTQARAARRADGGRPRTP